MGGCWPTNFNRNRNECLQLHMFALHYQQALETVRPSSPIQSSLGAVTWLGRAWFRERFSSVDSVGVDETVPLSSCLRSFKAFAARFIIRHSVILVCVDPVPGPKTLIIAVFLPLQRSLIPF